MKRKLITVYGINNMGKSTHCELIVEHLIKEGHKAIYIKYPKYDIEPTGPFLWKTLRSKEGQKISEDELQLWFVLNRYQYQPELKRFLKEGYIVVAEDYVGTGIAWGVAKGLNFEWLERLNENLIKEDFSIMIEGERVTSAKEKHHVHEQNEELIKKCKKVHQKLAKKYNWAKVTLQPKINDTADLMWKAVDGFLSGR